MKSVALICAQAKSASEAAVSRPGRGHGAQRPFNLMRWFAGLSLVCVLATALMTGALLSRFLTTHMLQHDAEVQAEFLNSMVRAERTWSYFTHPGSDTAGGALERFFDRVVGLPGMVRANVFAQDGTVLWSSTPSLIGHRFPNNEELEHALAGQIAIEFGTVSHRIKEEHVQLAELAGEARFVEAYLPVHGSEPDSIVGAVEIYRIPVSLFNNIDEGVRRVWQSAVIGALLLYGGLLWIVARASHTIRSQQARIVESETLATFGALASAVAHGVRNPLAAIRSSAELAEEEEEAERVRDCLADIRREADRMEHWVRDLLQQSRSGVGPTGFVDVNLLLQDSLRSFTPAAERQGVRLTLKACESLPAARGSFGPLAQAIENLIANAIEAMPEGGELALETRAGNSRAGDAAAMVEVRIADNGPGLPASLAQGTAPLFTSTKPRGTGLGLTLARRIIGGYGGSLNIESLMGRGTTVTVRLPAVSGQQTAG